MSAGVQPSGTTMATEMEGVSGSWEDRDNGQLLSIFSAEVWLLILNNVKEASDFQRISDASPYFGSLLSPRKTEVLFPPVIKILVERQPELLYPLRETVPMREVCRGWKVGMDAALQDQQHFYLLNSEQKERFRVIESSVGPTDGVEVFENEEDFQKFEKHFDPTHWTSDKKNPFLVRGIVLSTPEDLIEFLDYYKACVNFLQKYGSHVWHCAIYRNLEDADRFQLEFYQMQLKRLLGLMPNLRSCNFLDQEYGNFEWICERYDDLTPIPFPILPQLRKVDILGLPLSLLQELVESNPHIQILDAADDVGSSEEHVEVYLEQMPNLTRLAILLNTDSEVRAFFGAQPTCALEILDLELGVQLWNWKTLFRAVNNHFSNTLTQLSLQLSPPRKTEMVEESEGLTLPKLKQLTVKLYEPAPLDFVLPLKEPWSSFV